MRSLPLTQFFPHPLTVDIPRTGRWMIDAGFPRSQYCAGPNPPSVCQMIDQDGILGSDVLDLIPLTVDRRSMQMTRHNPRESNLGCVNTQRTTQGGIQHGVPITFVSSGDGAPVTTTQHCLLDTGGPGIMSRSLAAQLQLPLDVLGQSQEIEYADSKTAVANQGIQSIPSHSFGTSVSASMGGVDVTPAKFNVVDDNFAILQKYKYPCTIGTDYLHAIDAMHLDFPNRQVCVAPSTPSTPQFHDWMSPY